MAMCAQNIEQQEVLAETREEIAPDQSSEDAEESVDEPENPTADASSGHHCLDQTPLVSIQRSVQEGDGEVLRNVDNMNNNDNLLKVFDTEYIPVDQTLKEKIDRELENGHRYNEAASDIEQGEPILFTFNLKVFKIFIFMSYCFFY